MALIMDAADRLSFPQILHEFHRRWRGLKAWGRFPKYLFKLRRSRNRHSTGHCYEDYFVVTAGRDKADALATLLHEMAHAAVGFSIHHRPPWRAIFVDAAEEVVGTKIQPRRTASATTAQLHRAVRDALALWIGRHELRYVLNRNGVHAVPRKRP